MSRRSYQSELREAQAVETRGRILASSKRLFQKKGFESVTVDKLAEAAEVSPSMIYTLFRSKRGILQALIDEALPSKKRLALVDEVMREKSAKKRLVLAAKISRQLYDAEKSFMDILRGAPLLSPGLKKLEKEREERRYKRQEESFQMMIQEKVLKDELSHKQARDILWAFTGRDLYRMLVIERGWSSQTYEDWLAEQLINTLIVS